MFSSPKVSTLFWQILALKHTSLWLIVLIMSYVLCVILNFCCVITYEGHKVCFHDRNKSCYGKTEEPTQMIIVCHSQLQVLLRKI